MISTIVVGSTVSLKDQEDVFWVKKYVIFIAYKHRRLKMVEEPIL